MLAESTANRRTRVRSVVWQAGAVQVHLVDGTYELFRQHFGLAARARRRRAVRRHRRRAGVDARSCSPTARPTSAWPATTSSRASATTCGPATRRAPACRPELLEQIPVMEEALVAMGVTTWAMVEHEADDALGAGGRGRRRRRAGRAGPDRARPTRTSASACAGTRVVQFDRRKREIIDEDGVIAKFGVGPASIPDYLGLVGDTADGFPGLAGWGAKSAAAVLARYGHLEDIPARRRASGTSRACAARPSWPPPCGDDFELALLFRRIATVETDVDVGAVDEWAWTGPTDAVRRLGRRRRRAPPRRTGRGGRRPSRGRGAMRPIRTERRRSARLR